MKRGFLSMMVIVPSLLLLLCFSASDAYSRGIKGHSVKNKKQSSNKSSSKSSCKRSDCKGQRSPKSKYKNSAADQGLPVRFVRGLNGKDGKDGKDGERGEPGEAGQCDCTDTASSPHVLSALSNEIQEYKGDGVAYQDITFNQNVVVQGWKHELGTADFQCPETALYYVTYGAGASKFQKATYGGVTIRARFGPSGAEQVVKGSDTSVFGANFIKSTGTSFPLRGVKGENLKLEFLGDGPSCQLSSRDNDGTTVSLTIVKL